MQNKFINKCMSTVGIIIVLLATVFLYQITGYRSKQYNRDTGILSDWTVYSEEQTYTDVDLDMFRFDDILEKDYDVYLLHKIDNNSKYQTPVFVLKTYNTAISVFIDDELIYSNGQKQYENNKIIGTGYHFVSLPTDGREHTLTVGLKTAGDSHVSKMNNMYVTDYSTVYADYLVSSRIPYALSVCLIFIGFVLILTGSVISFIRSGFSRLVLLGIFSLDVGFWTICKYNILQVYGVPLWICALIEYTGLYTGTFPLMLFLKDYVEKSESIWFKRIYKGVFCTDSIVTVLLFVLHILGIAHLPKFIYVKQILMGIVCVYLIVLMVWCAKRGNKASRLIISGIILFLLCIGTELFGYVVEKYSGLKLLPSSGISALGTLFFISVLLISFCWDIAGKMIDEKEQAVLYKMAYTDNLTGLYNRRFCDEKLKSYRYNKIPFAIFNFDMNGLKATNDTHGHSSGDTLIKGFAQLLTSAFGEKGFVGRMGGDEFIVIVENNEQLNWESEIQNFQKIMREANEKQSGYVYSAAYGYADSSEIFSDNDVRDVNFVYRLADNRMYENKKTYHAARK